MRNCFYKRMRRICLLIILCILLPSARGFAFETRDDLRTAWRAIQRSGGNSPYARLPNSSTPYESGALTQDALLGALNVLNFVRETAQLDPVRLSDIYNAQCQNGALLLAALDTADHDPAQPKGMNSELYESGHRAAASSNIAKLNWMRPEILEEGILYFVRDDGDANLPELGHRRWVLNPSMGATGFGLANSETGMSYVLMYAHDLSNEPADHTYVAWPSEGWFPVELMHSHLAWSVSLDESIYDLDQSHILATLSEDSLRLNYHFDCTLGTGDGYAKLDRSAYGFGACAIFRPDFNGTAFADYLQNQVWHVRIDGLSLRQGGTTSIEYDVRMASLYVQEPVNVELDRQTLRLNSGETLQLYAMVVPNYADDLSIYWESSDEAVATVDPEGMVRAIGRGEATIFARSANGREDRCVVQVED